MKSKTILSAPRIAVLGAVSALSYSAMAEQLNNLETIEVVGHLNQSSLNIDIQSTLDSSPDYRDSLSRLPGVDVNGNGPVTGIPQYRGLFGERLAISIDGAPIAGAGPNAMDSPLSHVVAKPETQLIFYRGIAPVSAGLETLGGAVKVETNVHARFSKESEVSGRVQMQRTNQGSTEHLSGFLGYSTDAFYGSVNGLDQKRDDIEDGRGLTVPNSYYDRVGFGAELGFRNAQHSVYGTYQRIDTDDSGTPALAMDINYINAAWYRLNYTYQRPNDIGTDMGLHLKIYGNSNQHGMNNFAYRPLSSPSMARLNTVDSLARGYEATWQDEIASGNISAGLTWDQNRHNSVITNPIMNTLSINNFNQIERTRKSAYLEWQAEMDEFSMVLGSRLTKINAQADNVANNMAMMNPNLAALVQRFNQSERDLSFSLVDLSANFTGLLDDAWQWHGSVAQKNRAPSYTELYVWLPLGISAGLADGNNYLGNLELTEETSRQVDLGISYTSDSLTVSPRIFYQSIQDYIVGSPSQDALANMVSTMMTGKIPLQWENADATIWGGDVLISAQLSQQITLEMNASVVRGTRDDLNQPLYRLSPSSLNTRINWFKDKLSFSVESLLFASQERVSTVQNETASGGYGLINMSSEYQFNEYASISFAVKNLFDKTYQSHLGGINRVADSDVVVGDRLYETGREVSASVTLKW